MDVQTDVQTGELEVLMQQALAGDKRAYAAALNQTAKILRPYLSKRLADKNAIEDIVQEILISVHKARHTYDGKRPYAPWLFAIARYRLQDFLRSHYKDRLRHSVDLSEAEYIIMPDVTEEALSYELMIGAIRKLPDKQSHILQLIHGEGYTAKEVAEKMGMTESAVKVSAHRAYKVLRKQLGQL